MLTLNQNTGNTIALTLNESATLTSTTYLMTLTNDMSLYEVSGITLTDTSSYPDRYNKFILTPTTTRASQNLANSIVFLSDAGYYQYKCYTTGGQLLEVGKFLLEASTQIIPKKKYTKNDKKVKKVYQNK